MINLFYYCYAIIIFNYYETEIKFMRLFCAYAVFRTYLKIL